MVGFVVILQVLAPARRQRLSVGNREPYGLFSDPSLRGQASMEPDGE
jgi:hypothetical protein